MTSTLRRADSNSFVPADNAEIGITDKILVKSNSEDSVSQVPRMLAHK
jgi:DNA mismatch repair protein MSH5